MLHMVHLIERRCGRSPVRRSPLPLLVSATALLLGLGLQGIATASAPGADSASATAIDHMHGVDKAPRPKAHDPSLAGAG